MSEGREGRESGCPCVDADNKFPSCNFKLELIITKEEDNQSVPLWHCR